VVTTSHLDQLLDWSCPERLAELGLGDLRAARVEGERVEAAVSYVRRIVHGRIDIVEHERARRLAGDRTETLAELLDVLPGILGTHLRGLHASPGRFTPDGEPTDLHRDLLTIADAVAGAQVLANLGDLDDDALADASSGLASLERDLSAVRRDLHRSIDRLKGEITERYQRGELSLEGLLA
jgi:hypothetical protein